MVVLMVVADVTVTGAVVVMTILGDTVVGVSVGVGCLF